MKIRRSKRQSAWEYMRRNRRFVVGNVMAITELGGQAMKLLLSQLRREEIVRTYSKRNIPMSQKVYEVLDASSVVCPVKSTAPKIDRGG